MTCFVVRVGARRKGLAEFLLDGAVDLARRHDAHLVEAYPLDTSVRAASAGELFHGPLSVFLRAGFREVGARAAPARPVVRLELGHGGGSARRPGHVRARADPLAVPVRRKRRPRP